MLGPDTTISCDCFPRTSSILTRPGVCGILNFYHCQFLAEYQAIAYKSLVLHYALPYNTTLHCNILPCVALTCIALNCTDLHCTTLHFTSLHCTAVHCTALQYTALYTHVFQEGTAKKNGHSHLSILTMQQTQRQDIHSFLAKVGKLLVSDVLQTLTCFSK